MLSDRPDELGFLREALEIGEEVSQGARSAVLLLREGLPSGSPIDLGAFLSSMIPQLAAEAGRGIRLRIAPGSESLPIRGHGEVLDRAFRYLVREARLASPTSDRVRISWGRVNPEGRSDREGNGFLASEVARIRITYRGSVRTRPISGPLFVDAVIEAHGGWVERAGRATEETVVDLYLPLALPALSRSHGTPNRATGEYRILLVEDEPLLARLVERTLLRSGHHVEVAASAMEAERIWRHLDGAIDLIVADRSLTGGVSGAEVALHLRKGTSDLPLVLLDRGVPVSASDPGSALEAEFPTLRRPFEAADILRVVRGALRSAFSSPPVGAAPPSSSSEQAH
jgi:CheY-like chemotaxis protein